MDDTVIDLSVRTPLEEHFPWLWIYVGIVSSKFKQPFSQIAILRAASSSSSVSVDLSRRIGSQRLTNVPTRLGQRPDSHWGSLFEAGAARRVLSQSDSRMNACSDLLGRDFATSAKEAISESVGEGKETRRERDLLERYIRPTQRPYGGARVDSGPGPRMDSPEGSAFGSV